MDNEMHVHNGTRKKEFRINCLDTVENNKNFKFLTKKYVYNKDQDGILSVKSIWDNLEGSPTR